MNWFQVVATVVIVCLVLFVIVKFLFRDIAPKPCAECRAKMSMEDDFQIPEELSDPSLVRHEDDSESDISDDDEIRGPTEEETIVEEPLRGDDEDEFSE